MRDQHLEQTIQRIERALARIAAAADASTAQDGPVDSDFAAQSESMRSAMRNKVRAQLERLDSVIGELEK